MESKLEFREHKNIDLVYAIRHNDKFNVSQEAATIDLYGDDKWYVRHVYKLTASELRQIADKLDELNGIKE